MLTLDQLVKRYPGMGGLLPDRFDILREDAILVMGKDESRWIEFYDVAMAALIAHMAFKSDALADDDSGMAFGPVTRTDVDDVQVEFGKVWDKVPYQEADLYSTGYGQDYVRWRRMTFAGPRVA